MIGFLNSESPDLFAYLVRAFRQGFTTALPIPRSFLNYGDDPIIRRPDENDRAFSLIREEPVVLKLGDLFVKQARHRIKGAVSGASSPTFASSPTASSFFLTPKNLRMISLSSSLRVIATKGEVRSGMVVDTGDAVGLPACRIERTISAKFLSSFSSSLVSRAL